MIRSFVPVLVVVAFGGCTAHQSKTPPTQVSIISVNGFVPDEKLGITLPHEHVLVDFIGADQVSLSRYNADEVFETVSPYLQKIKQLGCQTLVECTPAYLGRDVILLQRLSRASGLTILTNTGYYGARQGKFLPAHAFTETAEQLAARWILEAKQGIDNTGIKPGFLKISVDEGPLSVVNQKIVKAATLTHLKTGLTIASHTGNGEAALARLKLLQQQGVTGNAFIWVHAQNEKNAQWHLKAAKMGAWLEFDGIGEGSITEYIQILQKMKKAGLLNQVLISQDAGWYHVGEKQGGVFRGYETLLSTFLPALKRAGFTHTEIKQLVEINPKKAFAAAIRK